MRYFFHIVDRYGLFPDMIGFDRADRNSAVLHAERIAAELARGGEFFRSGAVLVTGAPIASATRDRGAGTRPESGKAARLGDPHGQFCPRLLQRIPDRREGTPPIRLHAIG
jgi:hypothetical protein